MVLSEEKPPWNQICHSDSACIYLVGSCGPGLAHINKYEL